jgi:hypothetical protein
MLQHAKQKTPADGTSTGGQIAKDAWQAAIGFCYALSIHDFSIFPQDPRFSNSATVQQHTPRIETRR